VRLKTPHGDFDYEVHDTLIVKPEDVWVHILRIGKPGA